jgi:predicted DNA-binding protein (MmcQ/YjbR family)
MVRRDWRNYCLAKPGAWLDEPWEGNLVAKVGGKIFAFWAVRDRRRGSASSAAIVRRPTC